ncbi:MAG: hypothetical protein J4F44_05375 [Acidimicrobiia bacterium]|nr:hypothetical protein [Acidimicrobiia bacterium]
MSLEFWCPLRPEAAAVRRGARNARVVRTGMGPRRAAAFAAGRWVPGDRRPGAIVVGLAGAVTDSLEPGDVIVADTVHGPGPDRSAWGQAAETVRVELREAGVSAVRGPVRSVTRAVRGAERRRLAGDGALAADMESWWLLAADPAPLAVVRVVCDTPAAELVSLSLPWRARRALAVISRIAAALSSRETPIAPDRWRGLERAAPGGSS